MGPPLVAETETAPLTVRPVDEVPMRAVVVWSSIASATTASTATPPAAPASALVVVERMLLALTARLAPPLKLAPSASVAPVVSVMRLSATEAPMPTLPPEAPLAPVGSALALAVMRWSAAMAEAPVPALTLAPVAICTGPRSMRLSASEPAMPILPPPAPEVAVAS